jgi:hypothetical protein
MTPGTHQVDQRISKMAVVIDDQHAKQPIFFVNWLEAGRFVGGIRRKCLLKLLIGF